MGYHILLTKEKNFNICIEKEIYGGIRSVGSSKSEDLNSQVIAGFAGVKKGDFVFFYVMNIGLYGLWRVITRPFYDDEKIWDDNDQIFPYRFCFEPIVRDFPNHV